MLIPSNNEEYSTGAQRLWENFWSLMKPKPQLTVSEYADRYINIPAGTSAESGPWKTSRVPYAKEIMNCANDPRIHVIVMETCSQIAKTEIIKNISFAKIDLEPCHIGLLRPTIKDAEDFSKSRYASAIRESPRLIELFGADFEKSRKSNNTTLDKYALNGGRIVMMGSNSTADLSGKPLQIVIGDEIDRFEVTKEGYALDIIKIRMSNFWNWLFILTSTPGNLRTSEIHKWYERSDKRQFLVPCEHCGDEILLQWRDKNGNYRVVYDHDGLGNPLPHTARYCCQECGALLTDTALNRMVIRGRWKATAPFNGIAGFGDFPALYSPWVTMETLAKEWVEAQGDTESLKVFVNTRLGQPWEDEHEGFDVNEIYERREPYSQIINENAALITAFTDVQKDRLEVLTMAWGRDETAWALEKMVFYGDPNVSYSEKYIDGQNELFNDVPEIAPGVWNQLDLFLQKRYDHALGVQMPISIALVDSGDGSRADAVYQYVRPRQRRGVYAFKGGSERGRAFITPPTRKNKGKVNLYVVGVFAGKDLAKSRLNIANQSRPGYIHWPDTDDFDLEFFEQVCSEQKFYIRKNGKVVPKWDIVRQGSKRNEGWDMLVGNFAALRIRCRDRDNLNRRVDALQAKIRERDEGIPAPQSKKRVRRMRSKVEI